MDNQIFNAYTAGLIDGEGSISLSRVNPNSEYRYPVVSIPSTTYAFLKFLKATYGGRILKLAKREEHHKQSWRWEISGQKAIEMLPRVIPYMLEPYKVYRAKLLINEYHNVTPRNGRYNTEARTRKLDFEYRFFHPDTTIDQNP